MTEKQQLYKAHNIQEFANYLEQSYGWISKFDAVKLGCKTWGLIIKESKTAYESIEAFDFDSQY